MVKEKRFKDLPLWKKVIAVMAMVTVCIFVFFMVVGFIGFVIGLVWGFIKGLI